MARVHSLPTKIFAELLPLETVEPIDPNDDSVDASGAATLDRLTAATLADTVILHQLKGATLDQLLADQEKPNHLPLGRRWRLKGERRARNREFHEEVNRAWAEREYQSPDWSLGNVMSWIAFRDPALICRFESRWSEGRKIESRQRLFLYGCRSSGKKRQMLVNRPDQVLLAALQRGELRAIRNGAEIPSRHWFGKDVRDLIDDLRFRRDEGIKCWPSVESNEAAPMTPTASEPSTEISEALAQILKPRGAEIAPVRDSAAPLAPDTSAPVVSRKGRKPNSGRIDDEAPLRAMCALLADGRAPSVLAAAKQIAPSFCQA